MKELILSNDMIARYCPDDYCYKTSFKHNNAEVEVFFLTESQDSDVLCNMRSTFLRQYERLPSVDSFFDKYMEDSVSEETIDILREYRNEPSLSKNELKEKTVLGIIRIDEECVAECDYIYDSGMYRTRFTIKETSDDSVDFMHSCTEEKE